MNSIQGSSDKSIPADEIAGDGTGVALPEIKDTETKDVEYDEFKQYDDNVIEMKEAEARIPDKPKLLDNPKDMLLSDMTIEQLRNAVINLMNENKQLKAIKQDYEERARRIQGIWNNPKEIKLRLRFLRTKGVKVK